ncbi:hypothetical protein [Lewinella sp. LCG006]|uniref:hypothetical protein n=1 Tax=Lewinella sp. LCG006 TaxID=3231911 RepID=UPI003460E422
MRNGIVLWGCHPRYAHGLWIKLAFGHNKKEFAYREKLGFELSYLPVGQNPNKNNGYEPGHPWYYFLGGTVRTPRQIMEAVQNSGYLGYDVERIEKADARMEPQHSEALRQLKTEALDAYKKDLARYRELAFQLSQKRKNERTAEQGRACEDIHVNLSLKHNHLYNRFAHLIQLEERLQRQLDLFG